MAGLVALWDQQRWQPWFYQYLFMLGALALYGSGSPEVNREKALNACRVVVVGHLPVERAPEGKRRLCTEHLPLAYGAAGRGATPGDAGNLVSATPFMGPLVEIAYSPRPPHPALQEPGGRSLPSLLHAFILFSIGPFGLMFNTVVWPWNVAAATATVLLFWRTSRKSRSVTSSAAVYSTSW